MNTKNRLKGVLALAFVALPVSRANASSDADCKHFSRGTEILGNITEYYYTYGGNGLHPRFLKLLKGDASAAKNIAAARMKPGQDCGSLQAAVNALGAAYDKEMSAIDKAFPICTKYPAAVANAGDCLPYASAALKIDSTIRADGGVLAGFIAEARAHPECTELDMNSEDKLGADTEEAVFTRLLKQPCERDDRCASARIGKLREARGELGKVSDGDPILSGAAQGVRPLLFHQAGEATDATFSSADGAEGLLWHLTTYNSYWGGNAHDDNVLLFVATMKVATAYRELQPTVGLACPGY